MCIIVWYEERYAALLQLDISCVCLSTLTLTQLHLSLSIHNTTVRKMDVSGRGYLTNDKVYRLMEESLRLQKDVFKMKKVIVG